MTTLFSSLANVLVAEMTNQAQSSSSLTEIVKIIAISSVWIGGLILWICSIQRNKAQNMVIVK